MILFLISFSLQFSLQKLDLWIFFFLILPPPVERITKISPLLPLASTCLSKYVSKPKSFPQAVNDEDGPVSNCVETGFLFFFEKVHINSPPKCSTSEQDPPFPAKSILFPFLLHLIISSEILIIFFSSLTNNFNVSDRLFT